MEPHVTMILIRDLFSALSWQTIKVTKIKFNSHFIRKYLLYINNRFHMILHIRTNIILKKTKY